VRKPWGQWRPAQVSRRLDITKDNSSFTGEIPISGAELRLNREGRFGAVSNMRIEAGGMLRLDSRGTLTSPAGGTPQHIGQINVSTTTMPRTFTR